MAKKNKISSLAKALLETASDMRKTDVMDKAIHEKIKLRHLGAKSGQSKDLAQSERRVGSK